MSRSALFFWGGWDGHEPERCVAAVAPAIESAGFDVTVASSLAVLDDAAALRRFSVIVPVWTMGEISAAQEEALLQAVAAGVGAAGWHGGMGDAFRSAANYQFMVGGQFVSHPGGMVDYGVEIVDPAHPVTRGLHDFRLRSEQYYMHVDPSNHVLAATTFSAEPLPWIAGCRMPVAWTRPYGEGRVFYCSLGHDAATVRIPQVLELIRRGILWAARALVGENP